MADLSAMPVVGERAVRGVKKPPAPKPGVTRWQQHLPGSPSCKPAFPMDGHWWMLLKFSYSAGAVCCSHSVKYMHTSLPVSV